MLNKCANHFIFQIINVVLEQENHFVLSLQLSNNNVIYDWFIYWVLQCFLKFIYIYILFLTIWLQLADLPGIHYQPTLSVYNDNIMTCNKDTRSCWKYSISDNTWRSSPSLQYAHSCMPGIVFQCFREKISFCTFVNSLSFNLYKLYINIYTYRFICIYISNGELGVGV